MLYSVCEYRGDDIYSNPFKWKLVSKLLSFFTANEMERGLVLLTFEPIFFIYIFDICKSIKPLN